MKRIDTELSGVYIIEHPIFQDNRGSFTESYNQAKFTELGINCLFVQDNHSTSQVNVIRGLHYQIGEGQMKLVRCTKGTIIDIIVDIRPNSPTFKKWINVELSSEDNRLVFIPAGFAHGFCVIAGPAEVQYKCSSFYDPNLEKTIRYNDSSLNIQWPIDNPIISDRDRDASTLEEACKY